MLLAACSGPPDPRVDDTPTRGEVVVLADEDLRSMIEAQRKVFEHFYDNARLRIHYLPEARLREAMLGDSVRAVFTTCLPDSVQFDHFRKRNFTPDAVPILVDAIALVRAHGGAEEPVDVAWLKRRLTDRSGRTCLVSGAGNGVARTLADSLFDGDGAMITGAAATDGLDALIDRVASDTALTGLISFALISDLDDPRCRELRERVRLIPIAADDTSRAVMPSQGTLADGGYPLRRRVYAILTEWKSGLGTGFVSFVAGHKGQRIILKHGLAPHKVPAREVQIVNE